MSVRALERLRLEAAVVEASTKLASAEEAFRVLADAIEAATTNLQRHARAVRADEGMEGAQFSVPALERGRLDRAGSLAAAVDAAQGLRAGRAGAEAAVRSAARELEEANRALERHQRAVERLAGR